MVVDDAWILGAEGWAAWLMEMLMRLVTEEANGPDVLGGRGDLLSLGWSGLGKVVQIESLSLMGLHFEEMAMASGEQDSDSDLLEVCDELDGCDGFVSGDAA